MSHDHTPLRQLVAGHEAIIDVGVLQHEGLCRLPAGEDEGGPSEVPQGPRHHQPPLPLVAASQGNHGVTVSSSLGWKVFHNKVLEDIVRVDGGRTATQQDEVFCAPTVWLSVCCSKNAKNALRML